MTATAMSSSMNASKISMPEGWVKTGFPATVDSTKQSIKFVKRLVAIGFSQILYLRTEVPEDCFKDHEVGDLNLKMLKAKSSYDHANKLIKGLTNAMEALDKGYLRQLVIVIMEDKTKPDDAFETYTFNFNKHTDGNDAGTPGFSLVQTSKNGAPSKKGEVLNGNVRSIIESESLIDMDSNDDDNNNNAISGKPDQHTIYKATKRLLKKLMFAIQDLSELPEQSFMTVQVGYHDDLTPEEYQPRGFCASEGGICFVKNVSPKKIGQVKSGFHEIEMSMASKAFGLEKLADESACSEQQVGKENMNASFIPLKPGLDVSDMDQSRQESPPSKSTISKANPEVLLGSNRPGAHGDVQNLQVNEISDKMKQLNARDIETREEHFANTTQSSIRSQKSVRSIRRISSARDTFSNDASFEKDAKASKSVTSIRV